MNPARKILHADCDCFYAAVEMRDNPALREIPLAIGGSAEGRGVIATCNYPARTYGIHSAMPTVRALRLCPHLTLLSGDFERYREASSRIQAIFHELTPLVEPLSLDEAFLDVTAVTRFSGSATWMARWLKEECQRRVGITVSVGAAPSKFLAKIASDWEKPDGLTVISPDRVDAFIETLPVTKLHGVGPATARRLKSLDIDTCHDLQRLPQDRLIQEFGKFGHRLFELARGIDVRPVRVERERKSVSVEATFASDLPGLPDCYRELAALCDRLESRMARHGHPPLAGLFVKVRFDDFSLTTMEGRGGAFCSETFSTLMEQAWARKKRPVRLLGVGARLVPEDARRQLILPL
ncbi:DNA polymerase IV [Halomonas sp. DQ26W]|uniref:DNA polymerase IV n=1 Tax=Halomonas sp. DQ26W TaxID=2282311 RepID=UPI000DF7D1D6|nr:DNA polymerase IV [Halomonas sp. DQ26W]RDB41800.1 DNA polymerase IV [Halomonas sp. DQ26W]